MPTDAGDVVRVDVHQHLWTAPLLEALERRDRVPFVVREDGVPVLHLAGEPAAALEAGGEPARRLALLERDGVDRALIAISSPLGIEALPRAEALELIAAHLDGVLALGDRFAAWGPLALEQARAADVDELLARGCAGISLPAGALGSPAAVRALAPVLERIERHGAPLFVHPGPGLGAPPPAPDPSDPPWWPALTRYVAEMQAAWLAFVLGGRDAHPRLRVVFAMLAGGAPLLTERLVARGVEAPALANPQTFYDTSSYGPRAIEAMAERVGAAQLLHGSDRPVAEPQAGGRARELRENAGRMLRGG